MAGTIRKRPWTTSKGETKFDWTAYYTDQAGNRRNKAFDTKKAADMFLLRARGEVRDGLHIADGASITVKPKPGNSGSPVVMPRARTHDVAELPHRFAPACRAEVRGNATQSIGIARHRRLAGRTLAERYAIAGTNRRRHSQTPSRRRAASRLCRPQRRRGNSGRVAGGANRSVWKSAATFLHARRSTPFSMRRTGAGIPCWLLPLLPACAPRNCVGSSGKT